MNKQNESQSFFGDGDLNKDKLFVDIPDEQISPDYDRIPNGYDPMGEIYLRGRAFRSMAGGRIPWWVLISGWILFGSMNLLILLLVIVSQSFAPLVLLVITLLPVIILWRGTFNKISSRKRRKG
ncbi:hypothetical protein H6F32_14205 [Anabaena sp. FACHB-1237]|uniref:hypothetical protein n=1 Tax=Anabaena sp. FACHB-1237 TaxID=2692769 RepID=UPI001680C8CB|nr:hypothetical protein [Anabaena sp. FACHB-1237]MBD2138709.1 hypothetical protein [Anabaena sp. FACHB-1237]